MVEIKEAGLIDGTLKSRRDTRDAAGILLSHLEVEPDFVRTAPHTSDGVTEWIRRKRFEAFWFAEMDDRRVGMIGLSNHLYQEMDESQPEDVEICRLIVTPEMRGKGIGKKLFQVALASCEGRSPWLTVLVGSDADKMYRCWGWVELGRVPIQDDPMDRIVALKPPGA